MKRVIATSYQKEGEDDLRKHGHPYSVTDNFHDTKNIKLVPVMEAPRYQVNFCPILQVTALVRSILLFSTIINYDRRF